jgi:hypothetical protein
MNDCDKWLQNKALNPITGRKIKENGPTWRTWNKKCSSNRLNLSFLSSHSSRSSHSSKKPTKKILKVKIGKRKPSSLEEEIVICRKDLEEIKEKLNIIHQLLKR